MRMNGTDARSVLSALRTQIVGLEMRQREKLLEQLRLWEINRASGNANPVAPVGSAGDPLTPLDKASSPPPEASRTPVIKPLPGMTPPPEQPVNQPPAPATAELLQCPHCGKRNQSDEIFCGGCGQLLTMERSMFDTRHFIDNTDGIHSDEHFGPDTTLILMVKGTQETFKIRPQDHEHEVVIGRGAGAAMRPDIDLSPQQAALLGVSRLHMSVAYNEKHHTLSASDLGSSNGTFINGLRLHPEEVRVIRHGDELRLGKLVLAVYFFREQPPDTPAE